MATAKLLSGPLGTGWYRENEIESITYGRAGVRLRLAQTGGRAALEIRFADVQAVRITTEECAGDLLAILPHDGSCFEIIDSDWLRQLGRGEAKILDSSRHFVVGCGDELVEVVAWSMEFSPTAT